MADTVFMVEDIFFNEDDDSRGENGQRTYIFSCAEKASAFCKEHYGVELSAFEEYKKPCDEWVTSSGEVTTLIHAIEDYGYAGHIIRVNEVVIDAPNYTQVLF